MRKRTLKRGLTAFWWITLVFLYLPLAVVVSLPLPCMAPFLKWPSYVSPAGSSSFPKPWYWPSLFRSPTYDSVASSLPLPLLLSALDAIATTVDLPG